LSDRSVPRPDSKTAVDTQRQTNQL